MKYTGLGDYLLWEGKPAKVIAEANSPTVIIELIESCKCPHCQGDLGKNQFSVIVSSPLFQQNAEQLPTIQDDPTLIVA